MKISINDSLVRRGFYILCIALFCRLALLEITDLIDPTESRYASIAQEMLISKNWTTPHLPTSEGIEPYLGKPPLHFWLTALTYKVFGFEEWTSRLPSFISAFLILLTTGILSAKFFDTKTAILSCCILLSSVMYFFLAGASVVDVTLTATVSLSFFFLAYYFEVKNEAKKHALFAAAFAAAGFLTKGPIALILIAFPIFLWLMLSKNLNKLKQFPWFSSLLVFLTLTTPWFIFSEIQNPGFLKYFFWNENIARYLFKDYGDRYGSGHVYFRGMSWVMLIAAFFPWSFVLGFTIWKQGFHWCKNEIKNNKFNLTILCWAVAAPLFFTFVRQLHAMYILPAIPGFSILTASLLMSAIKANNISLSDINIQKFIIYISIVLSLCMFIAGLYISPSFNTFCFALPLIIAMSIYTAKAKREQNFESLLLNSSAMLVGLFLICIVSVTPFVNANRSGEDMLIKISSANPSGNARVGILASNNYSHYWASKAWQNELPHKLTVHYLEAKNFSKDLRITNILLKDGQEKRIPLSILNDFKTISDAGGWKWLRRKTKPQRL